jgi:phytol kinase
MLEFISRMIPSLETILLVTPISLPVIIAIAYISGFLKMKKGIKTNYTRKLFHFTIFSTAGLVGLFFGFSGTIVFGSWAGIFILLILYLGDGNIFYEGMAREQDEPHRSFYILVPFLSTAIAGLLDNFLFGQVALVGYLVAGWGDAAGEPIGVRFGKHKYRVPSRKNVVCYRSIEGSAAVFSVSTFASYIVLSLALEYSPFISIIGAFAAGLATALVEAFSPHGVDNFTTQFTSCLAAFSVLIFV